MPRSYDVFPSPSMATMRGKEYAWRAFEYLGKIGWGVWALQKAYVRVKEQTEALKIVYAAVSTVGRQRVAEVILPMLPNTGPGVVRPFVNQTAIPSPYK